MWFLQCVYSNIFSLFYISFLLKSRFFSLCSFHFVFPHVSRHRHIVTSLHGVATPVAAHNTTSTEIGRCRQIITALDDTGLFFLYIFVKLVFYSLFMISPYFFYSFSVFLNFFFIVSGSIPLLKFLISFGWNLNISYIFNCSYHFS